MTFAKAKKELAKLAKGEYRSIQYAEIMTGHHGITVECSVYISGEAWHEDETWEGALLKMNKAINPVRIKRDPKQAPKTK